MNEPIEYITVCELMRTHGVKGFIKAKPLTHDLTRHKSLKDILLKKVNGEEISLEIEESKQAGLLWLLKFKGYDTPESLVHFVNGEVKIPLSERLPAPEGEYYLDDLIGFGIELEDERCVGEVLDVLELPSVLAFEIEFKPEFKKEFSRKKVLAPWVDDCVLEIDDEREVIVCDSDYLKALCPENHAEEA